MVTAALWAACASCAFGSVFSLEFEVPFARAAIFAAELPEVRGCDEGPGLTCGNPFAAMTAWRYASNNLRRAVDLLPESERQMHKSTIALVAQICAEIESFFQEATAERMMIAVGNARQVFDALKDWMMHSPPSRLSLDSEGVGLPFLYGGRSLRLPAHPHAHPAEAEVRLANGVEMPVLGFGTWQLIGQQCFEATRHALQVGYRHIDTAQAYGNEAEVGRALAATDVPRRELFLVTKLSNPDEYGPQLISRFEAQLRDLRTDYVDLYMLHSPASSESMRLAWQSMERLYFEGRIRALGVSNFGKAELEQLLEFATVPPVYVQNKFSIYTPGEQRVNNDISLMGYLKEKNIAAWPASGVINELLQLLLFTLFTCCHLHFSPVARQVSHVSLAVALQLALWFCRAT